MRLGLVRRPPPWCTAQRRTKARPLDDASSSPAAPHPPFRRQSGVFINNDENQHKQLAVLEADWWAPRKPPYFPLLRLPPTIMADSTNRLVEALVGRDGAVARPRGSAG
mmetsp:Transcript_4060/g.7561  ORF Transcript_4060/g.7561 Transcript_4060/m.7561 type:complete len:109 (-) Transcript_4060:522-848(-)